MAWPFTVDDLTSVACARTVTERTVTSTPSPSPRALPLGGGFSIATTRCTDHGKCNIEYGDDDERDRVVGGHGRLTEEPVEPFEPGVHRIDAKSGASDRSMSGISGVGGHIDPFLQIINVPEALGGGSVGSVGSGGSGGTSNTAPHFSQLLSGGGRDHGIHDMGRAITDDLLRGGKKRVTFSSDSCVACHVVRLMFSGARAPADAVKSNGAMARRIRRRPKSSKLITKVCADMRQIAAATRMPLVHSLHGLNLDTEAMRYFVQQLDRTVHLNALEKFERLLTATIMDMYETTDMFAGSGLKPHTRVAAICHVLVHAVRANLGTDTRKTHIQPTRARFGTSLRDFMFPGGDGSFELKKRLVLIRSTVLASVGGTGARVPSQ